MQLLHPPQSKICLSFFLLVFFLSQNLIAQSDYRPGFIIRNSNDTIYGEINYRGDLQMANLCTFKNPSGEKSEFGPYDIQSYKFTDGRFFISHAVNGKQVFLEYLIKGKLNVYYLRDFVGDHYFVEKEDLSLTEIPYTEEIRHYEGSFPSAPGKTYLFQSTIHKNYLSLYTNDAPELSTKIQSMNKPDHQNMIKIAEAYHNLVCEDEKCTIFKKKVPFLATNLELVVGVVNYYEQEDYEDVNYFQIGALIHVWMPRINEKILFRSGILYSTLKSETETRILKIPIQFEYSSQNGIVRPKAALGINIYSPFYYAPSAMVGLNIRINDTILCSINYDVDFTPITEFALIPEKLLSNNISAGIYFKF